MGTKEQHLSSSPRLFGIKRDVVLIATAGAGYKVHEEKEMLSLL